MEKNLNLNKFFLKKKDLSNILEPYLLDRMDDRQFVVEKINSKKIVTSNRLDIGFKTNYLELKNKNNVLADYIYSCDLGSQTKQKFVDPDNKKKDNFDL